MRFPTALRLALFFVAAFLCKLAPAGQWQDAASLEKIGEAYVRAETARLPGKVTISIGHVDPRLRLPACPAPEAFAPPGTRLWGNAAVGIRCANPNWSLSVPVAIKVMAEVVVAARPLPRNRVIQTSDLASRTDDLAQLPAGVLADASQAVGKIAAIGVPAGTPLKGDMLRAPFVVLQGQKVRLVAQGTGFNVSAEGKALSDAAAGQMVSVRTASGKVVRGTAKAAGVVEAVF